MAGRILPVALATVSGVAIGMATFGEELKSQQMKRLTEEYNRDIAAAAAAAAAANSENTAAIAPTSTTVTPPPASIPPPVEEAKTRSASWSDALGFWAWKKSPQKDAVPAALAAPAVAQEAPSNGTTKEQTKKP